MAFVFGKNDIFDIERLSKEDRKAKNRHWNFLVYPESAPDDWLDRLRALHLPLAVSPLHDKDIDPTGEPKKAHYHCIISFDGPTTLQNANRMIQAISNGPICVPCHSVRGSYRYFLHLDNPDKYQYSESDVQCFNSFEISLTDSDEDAIKKAIMNIILVNRVSELAELILLLEYEFGWEYAKVARRNQSYVNAMITSIRHSPGPAYRRFLKYVSPEEFDLFCVDEEHSYVRSIEELQALVHQFDRKDRKKGGKDNV